MLLEASGAFAAGADGDLVTNPRPTRAQGIASYYARGGMGTVAHLRNSTQPARSLDEITAAIYARIDSFALDLGRELSEAFQSHPKQYEAWVTECLPFGLDKARRLRMIYQASRCLPDDVLARLPRPWQAAFAISRLPAARTIAEVEAGRIHPDLTVKETIELVADIQGNGTKRHSEGDLVIGRLVSQPVEAISDGAWDLLDAWRARR